MIPEFDEHGNLQPGIWRATVDEVGERFAETPLRQRLFCSLLEVLAILRDANCSEVYLNGSFITTAAEPADYDICYEPTGMQQTDHWKELLSMSARERKEKYLGDIFVRFPQPPFFTDHVEFWQSDREDNPKGIICIELRPQAND